MTDLEAELKTATGSDRALDRELALLLDPERAATPPDYTASVDRCIELVHLALPGWSWHVGWDAAGILPYATLHRGERLVEAAAPTVPLALLRALLKARREPG
jgi:hypothetical protein